MNNALLKAIIAWINNNRFTLQKWVLNVEGPRALIGLVDIPIENSRPLPWKIAFYKKELFELEAVVIGFSVQGMYTVNLPCHRGVFDSPEITAHLFAELVFDYSDTINNFSRV